MTLDTVTTKWKTDMLLVSDNPSGQNVFIDASPESGGHNEGLRPKALMLSSLAGCSGLDVASLLKKMKVEFDTFEIIVEAELTEEHPKYYHKVHVNYHFYGNNLAEGKINKAVKLSVDKYCGVMEMFRQFATVTTQNHFHNQ
ncbi:putative redox protein [Tenacibaculum adriaticum]|uniref:Putative redox protein n=1 Tax=Tenacibaculum adriaticum TaxID=413713 RepID=A0A5S5DUQ7_9FLAO|nr:OsmC family protein [Tenacibaculum adriaticum]TYP99611.1 putative redox protein [Tenacibaculum adriaticum]